MIHNQTLAKLRRNSIDESRFEARKFARLGYGQYQGCGLGLQQTDPGFMARQGRGNLFNLPEPSAPRVYTTDQKKRQNDTLKKMFSDIGKLHRGGRRRGGNAQGLPFPSGQAVSNIRAAVKSEFIKNFGAIMS
jgi:hypothetical protein